MTLHLSRQPVHDRPRTAVESLIVFSDDWGRHPSSCQHLIKRMPISHKVLWVNTIGTRAPRMDIATLLRGAEKVREWAGAVGRRDDEAPLMAGPEVIRPLMWPWFSRTADRWVNKKLLTRCINQAVARLPRPRIVVTTIPIVADLIGDLDVDGWLYYCVDDLALWPGLDGAALRLMEAKLVENVDRVVTVSQTLQHRMSDAGRASTLITHGVDLDLWRSGGACGSTEPLAGPAPRAVFWGLLDERLQSEWVAALADRLKQGSVVLVGPIENVDNTLRAHPRVFTTGPVAYENLPEVARSASVLIMPYKDLPVTRAMQPLKLKEYLATGLPVVARNLPAVADWTGCLDLASTPEEFVESVVERIDGGVPSAQTTARGRLSQEGWDVKAKAFLVEIEKAAC